MEGNWWVPFELGSVYSVFLGIQVEIPIGGYLWKPRVQEGDLGLKMYIGSYCIIRMVDAIIMNILSRRIGQGVNLEKYWFLRSR